MKYIVNKPLKFIDQFDFHKDKTPWEGEYKKEININKKGQKRICHYPSYKDEFREKCMSSYKEYLNLKNESIKNQLSSGLYLLFFCDFNMYYVGIASGDIEDRLSKHIVKVFGSFVGRGVNHTDEKNKGWRYLAKKIYLNDKENSYKYGLKDCFFVTINPQEDDINKISNYDKKLKFIENVLSDENHELIQKIIHFSNNSNNHKKWTSFNSKESGMEHEFKLVEWD